MDSSVIEQGHILSSTVTGEGISSSTNDSGIQEYPHANKHTNNQQAKDWVPLHTTHNNQLLMDPRSKAKTIKPLGEEMEISLCNSRLGNGF